MQSYRGVRNRCEILDAGAEIRTEILFEIRDLKSQAIFFPIISVKFKRSCKILVRSCEISVRS